MKAPLDSNVFNPLGNVILVYALLFLLIFFSFGLRHAYIIQPQKRLKAIGIIVNQKQEKICLMNVEGFTSCICGNVLGPDSGMITHLEKSMLENIGRCFVPTLKAVQHSVC